MHPDHDWLNERLLQHRKVALSGTLDREASSRVAAALAHLDATGDEPVTLWMSGLTADLDGAFTLVDTLQQMRAPVQATCVGTLTGAAIAVLAVADLRAAGPNTILHMCDPPPAGTDTAIDLATHAQQHSRQLRRLHECIASACRRPVDTIARDMRDERLLDAAQAQEYGLVDASMRLPRGG
jgi:ATP-dependent Clp protease protease subunit